MELQKMIDETIEKDNQAAKDLPIETKQAFWRAFHDEGMSIGEARKLVGIDLKVAVALIIQCYKTVAIPLEVDEIE